MLRILIIDDDSRIRASLASLLEEEGYAILSSSNGEEGLKIASNEKIDIVLLDVILPGRSGIEILK
ncbi:MAG: response regulator [bacterium]